MEKLTLKQRIQALNIDPIRFIIVILAILASINLIKYLLSSKISSEGSFEIASSPESLVPVSLPLFFSNEPLKGKELILQTRRSQIEHFNSTTNSSVFADESIFSDLDETLPWLDESDSANLPTKSLYNKGLVYGLLNPLVLVIPQVSIAEDQKSAASNIKNIFSIKDLTYNSHQKLTSATVTLPSLLINNSKALLDHINIITDNFNAFSLGFNFAQADLSNPINLEFIYPAVEASRIVSGFSAAACKPEDFEKVDAQKCNQMLLPTGNSAIKLKDLPASASFKLWKQAPEADTPPDMTFKINFEVGDLEEPIISAP